MFNMENKTIINTVGYMIPSIAEIRIDYYETPGVIKTRRNKLEPGCYYKITYLDETSNEIRTITCKYVYANTLSHSEDMLYSITVDVSSEFNSIMVTIPVNDIKDIQDLYYY